MTPLAHRRRRWVILAATLLLAITAYVAYARTGPNPTGPQVASVLARLPANTLARRITCRGSGSSWTCDVVGPGPGESWYDVHVGRDHAVTVPLEDGLGERRVCCVP